MDSSSEPIEYGVTIETGPIRPNLRSLQVGDRVNIVYHSDLGYEDDRKFAFKVDVVEEDRARLGGGTDWFSLDTGESFVQLGYNEESPPGPDSMWRVVEIIEDGNELPPF